eukprot:g5937.t1
MRRVATLLQAGGVAAGGLILAAADGPLVQCLPEEQQQRKQYSTAANLWRQSVGAKIAAEASEGTRRFLMQQRKDPFVARFGHLPPPSASGLEKYKFGREVSLGEKWRHKIFAFGLMAIVDNEFNGNKCGAVGNYPQRASQRTHTLQDDTGEEVGLYLGGCAHSANPGKHVDYTGHNIAALAVNEFGEVVLSAFNHNKIFGSTAEHAEMRLLDHCFRSPELHFRRADAAVLDDESEIEDKMARMTLYTSLEPCQQCAGKMLLAGVPLVVYCQRDRDIQLQALETYKKDFKTRPLPAVLFDFGPYSKLDDLYMQLQRAPPTQNFWDPPAGGAKSKAFKGSMPYFLCTDGAKGVFSSAARRFEQLMSADDAEFAALSVAEREAVRRFRPPHDLALRNNANNQLWSLRCDLLNFEYQQSREIALEGIDASWTEVELSLAIADVPSLPDVQTLNVMRMAGTGESRGFAYLTFATPADAHAAAAALEAKGFDPRPASNWPRLKRLLRQIAKAERKLQAMQEDDSEARRRDDARVLTNAEALEQMRQYVVYERKCERRGTMHR